MRGGEDSPPRPGEDCVMRHRLIWMLVFGAILGWIVTVTVLIMTAPPRGALSRVELAQRASAALNTRDTEALAPLLAEPLDHEFALAYVEHFEQAGAENLAVLAGPRHLVSVRGQTSAGPFSYRMAAIEQDGRLFLSPLPPI